ncbi:MAG TPA: type IV pilus assembly protein PilM [Candidatus Saccharimonadia bacterium]|nr:type IV pilus assembly protein PilM [Candidatus Saccharimonadia bacterium]
MMRVPLVYRERPIFGFDLGTRTAKMIQLRPSGKTMEVMGYGYAQFPDDAIVEGIVVDPQEIVKAIKPLLKKTTYGQITATRVAASLPVAKVFTRVLELPPMNPADLGQAVRLEAEQYIPVPLPDLYIDYETIEAGAERNEVLMVAAPRAIVDSYIKLFDLLGLEVALVDSSMAATTRAIVASTQLGKPTLVADIGSTSIDLTVHDKVIRLTDTVPLGGDSLTQQLVKDLGVGREQANEIKYKFGLGPSGLQPKVMASLGVPLKKMCDEMRRVMKFYQDRGAQKRKIEAIIVGGGSASMPGFLEYMAAEINVPVVLADPWMGLDMKHVEPVSKYDAPMYTSAIGLARLEGKL